MLNLVHQIHTMKINMFLSLSLPQSSSWICWMALGSYIVIDQLTKAKPSLATSAELASLQRVWMTSWSILEILCAVISLSDLHSCLQHQNNSLWKSRCQQDILFNWFMDSEKNAMPATMTTNCSLRLKRRIGGETRNRLKEEEEQKDDKK